MLLQSKRIWVLNQWIEAQIEVCGESGKIEAILPYGSAPADMDFGELRVVPGFIDVHTHGAYGFDHAGKALFEALKLLGVDDINTPKPAGELYPGENPFAV